MKRTPPPKKKIAVSGSNTEHSILSPSYSKTWLTCAAALAMGAGVKDEAGVAAQNGTVMHYLAETCIRYGLSDSFHSKAADPKTWVGSKIMDTPENITKKLPECDIVVTDEMARAVREYIDFAAKLKNTGAVIEVETRVRMTTALGLDGVRYAVKHPDGTEDEAQVEAFGTGDLSALVPLGDHSYCLYVGDLKTGRNTVLAEGEAGSRQGNTQLMLYAGGLLPYWEEKLKSIDQEGVIRQVCLVIIAPYMGFERGINTFSTTPEAVRIFMSHAGERAKLAIACLDKGKKNLKGADFKPTESGCKWCKARESCGAKNRMLFQELADMSDATPSTAPPAAKRKPAPPRRKPAPPRRVKTEAAAENAPAEMTPEEIMRAYAQLPMLRDHIKSVEAAMHRLMFIETAKGHKLPGWKLVRASGGNRKWSDEDKVAELLKGARFSEMQIFDRKLKSPKQLEELAAQVPRVQNKLKALMTRPEDKPVIAPANDTRPEWKPAVKADMSFE